MPRVFGSPRDSHPFEVELERLRLSGDPAEQSCGENIAWDYHAGPDVCPRREKLLLTFFDSSETACLDSCFRRYYLTLIRFTRYPDFLDRVNEGNFVASGLIGSGPMNADFAFAHVLNLNRLDGLFRSLRDRGDTYWESFPDGHQDSKAVTAWISARMKTDVFRRQLVEKALDGVSNNTPFHPLWMTPWDDMKAHQQDGPDRWLEVCGLAKHTADPHFVILLKFPARKAGTIVRPTVLESNWNSCFHPSAEASASGYAMDLGGPSLMKEFIAQQFKLEPWFWDAAGSGGMTNFGSAERVNADDLLAIRARHRGRIPETGDWSL